MQGELINESGTMTGGGGRPRSGRMCLGSAAPRRQGDDRESAAELAAAEKDLAANVNVSGRANPDWLASIHKIGWLPHKNLWQACSFAGLNRTQRPGH